MKSAAWLEKFVAACARGGLDLVRPFGLAAYQSAAPAEHRLDAFGRSDPLAVVIGNTRTLWPIFLARLQSNADVLDREHPLDDWVEQVVSAALAAVPVRWSAYQGHHRVTRVVPLQRIAAAAGLAELGPAHLSVHPEHGPWIGLRAVIVFDVDVQEACPTLPAVPRSHCADCARPCVPALERALRVSYEPAGAATTPESGFTPQQRAWVDVRDACPVGRSARYGATQLHYHYTKSQRTLQRALREPGAPNE